MKRFLLRRHQAANCEESRAPFPDRSRATWDGTEQLATLLDVTDVKRKDLGSSEKGGF